MGVYDYRAKAYARPYSDTVLRRDKYSPDQARDEHGRFGSGTEAFTVSGAEADNNARLAQERYDRSNAAYAAAHPSVRPAQLVREKAFNDKFPNVHLDIAALPDNLHAEVVDQLGKLGDQYPKIMGDLKGVAVDTNMGVKYMGADGPIAFTEHGNPIPGDIDSHTDATRGSRIVLNRDSPVWTNDPHVQAVWDGKQAENFCVKNNLTVGQYAVTHEFGHAVSNYVRDTKGTDALVKPYVVLQRDIVHLRYRAMTTYKGLPTLVGHSNTPVSEYATSSPAEGYAEAFVAHVVGSNSNNDGVKAVVTSMRAAGLIKRASAKKDLLLLVDPAVGARWPWPDLVAPGLKYAPDQERDDHGRFAGGGGTDGAGGNIAVARGVGPMYYPSAAQSADEATGNYRVENAQLAENFTAKTGIPVGGFKQGQDGWLVPTENAKVVLDTIAQWQADNPDMKNALANISFVSDGERNTIASSTPISHSSMPGAVAQIQFNTDSKFLSDPHSQALFDARAKAGWFPDTGASGLKYVTTHELGHVTGMYMTNGPKAGVTISGRDPKGTATAYYNAEAKLTSEKTMLRAGGAISQYAMSSPAEAWAESYAAAKLGGAKYAANPYVVTVRTALKAAGLDNKPIPKAADNILVPPRKS